jgi:mono/diheme cytochrome c family protein
MLISRLLRVLAVLFAVIMVAAWWMTRPQTIAATDLPDHQPDPAGGERVFWAGGCASCHASPVNGKRAKGDDKLLLGGGLELDTPYGVFRVPNISPHVDDGIGGWTSVDFVNAMQRLPPVSGRIEAHSLGFPWSVRRGIGAWKRRYLVEEPMTFGVSPTLVERGRLLVEGAGHCGECHTPRDRFGGMLRERWLAGAPNPEGKGRVPNITPGGENISEWSAADIAYYLESGFTPEFDTVGGSMVAVQENMAKLSAEDRAAIAA